MKEEDDEEEVFRAAADIMSTFPINNEIIFSEIRRVISTIKIDPRCGRACVRFDRRTHTGTSDLPMIIGHSGFSETSGEDNGRGRGQLLHLSRGRILNETGGSINVPVSRQVERRRHGIEADSTAG